MKLYYLDLTKVESVDAPTQRQFLTTEIAVANGAQYLRDSAESRRALMLLKFICQTDYQFELKQLNFNAYGKPATTVDGFQFNISHSGNLILIAIDDRAVGIDVEHCKKIDYRLIAKRFFSGAERDLLAANEYDIKLFYKIWTLKESYLKYLGIGLQRHLQRVDVSSHVNATNRQCGDTGELFVNNFSFATNYLVSSYGHSKLLASDLLSVDEQGFANYLKERRRRSQCRR